jgi:hypothetical protein
MSGRPPIACKTLGREERIRVPSPAASTIVRQVLIGISASTKSLRRHNLRRQDGKGGCRRMRWFLITSFTGVFERFDQPIRARA